MKLSQEQLKHEAREAILRLNKLDLKNEAIAKAIGCASRSLYRWRDEGVAPRPLQFIALKSYEKNLCNEVVNEKKPELPAKPIEDAVEIIIRLTQKNALRIEIPLPEKLAEILAPFFKERTCYLAKKC